MDATMRSRRFAASLVGLMLVGLLVVLRMTFYEELGPKSPFLFFLTATIIASVIGGFWPGVITTAAGAFAVDYALIVPRFEVFSGPNTWQALLFLGEGIFISVVVELLLRANRRARRAVTLRDDLMAVLAHDLRNMVAVVTGSAPLVKELLPPDVVKETGTGDLLDAVERTGNGMRTLVNDLLDTAKIEATGLLLDRADTDLVALAEESLALLTPLAAQRSLSLVVDGDRAACRAEVDPARIRQVLANLGGNALKFTPPGGSITLRVAGGPDRVELAVADTGGGIAPGDLPHLFDRFWQAGTPARKAGAGLGLFIVKGIVTAHHGKILVTSELGRGTTFTVCLPRRQPPAPAPERRSLFARLGLASGAAP